MRENFGFYNGDQLLLGFTLAFLYLIAPIGASIHEYRNEYFTPQLNAFLFHGGSEGLFASKHHEDHHDNDSNITSLTSPELKPLAGKSFIRFESVTFKRTSESAKIQNDMQSRTGLFDPSKVLILGFVYFLASESLEIVEHLGTINDFTGRTKLYLVLPVAVLDAWFILWIFSSLSKTLEKLQMRRSIAKLEVYRKFTNALALFVLVSIAWIGYELYFNATDPISELWRIYWIIPAFWSLLAFSLLVVICILWAPSRNPTRYAYAGDTGDDYDEEAISLTTGVKVEGGEVGTTVMERKEKKGLGSTDHLIGLTEDLAEDKRE
ncbi:putative transmembrane protein GPR107/GPR108 [Helianthus annuus]|nr:putative transmembrane protein GPR107/GPR108 [Helianthus annuus]